MAQSDPPSIATKTGVRCARWLLLLVLVFMTIVAIRFEVIDLPPYYDYAMGLWTEADYLAETGFDYYALRYENDHSFENQGGARSYMTSVLPSIVALFMIITPSPRASFVAYHLFIFACSAGVIVILYGLIRTTCGVLVASLATLAATTTPVFAVQIDMLSMEMPLILAALLTTWAVYKQRYVLAIAASTLAFFMKPTGSILTVAAGTYLAVRWWFDPDRASRRASLHGMLCSAAALVLQAGVLYWGDCFGNLIHPASGPFLVMSWYWFPDLLLLLALGGAVVGVGSAWAYVQSAAQPHPSRFARLNQLARTALTRFPLVCFAAIVVGGMLMAVNVVFFIPRYFALIVPFLYLVLASLLWQVPRTRRASYMLFGAIIALNLVNWNGALYVPHLSAQIHIHGEQTGRNLARESSHFERSHEYLAEHRANITGIRRLDAQRISVPVVAGHPYNHFLSLPRLGYVSEPPAGYSTLPLKNTQRTFRDISQIFKDVPRELIFVWAANGFCNAYAEFKVGPPNDGDQILYDDGLPSPLVIYRRTLRGSDRDVRAMLASHFSPGARYRPGAPLVDAWTQGDTDEVLAAFESRPISTYPPLARLPALAVLLHRTERDAEARRVLVDFLQTPDEHRRTGLDRLLGLPTPWGSPPPEDDVPSPVDPASAQSDVHLAQALARLREDRYVDAGWYFFASLHADWPEIATLINHMRLGIDAVFQGRLDKAYNHLLAASELEPELATPHHWLGIVAQQMGRGEEAVEHLRRAEQCLPRDYQIQLDLGVVRAEANQWAQAANNFRTAVQLDENSKLAKQYLRQAEGQLTGSRGLQGSAAMDSSSS